jgi:hypothetical protein
MAQADANRAVLRWGSEATWGLVSTDGGWAAPNMTILRYTGESLKYDKVTVRSNEIVQNRNVTDHIDVQASVSGDINGELSFATYDEWFRQLLFPNEAAAADGTAPIAATITGITFSSATVISITANNTITDSSNTFITKGFVAGMHIKLSGWVTTANNGIFKISAVAAGAITITTATLVVEGAGATRVVKGRMFRNGTGLVLGVYAELPSLIVEKEFTDLTNEFQHFVGLRVNQLQMSMASGQIATAVWSLMGKTMLGTAATVSAADTAANTNTVMNATTNIGTFLEGGSAMDVYVKDLSLTFKNNLRNQDAIGYHTPIGMGTGWFELEGKMSVYFKDATMYNKLINHTSTSFSFRLTDASGNVYIFTIPKIRILKGEPLVSGGNSDIMLPVEFAAYYDSTTDCMAQLDILAA